jgi:LysM repeat protein
MKVQPRSLAFAVFGIGPLLLAAGCGSTATGSRTTLAAIQPSSYVTIVPVTTTTTIPVPTTIADGTSADAQVYTVAGGDSVFKIASLFNVPPDTLASFNMWPEGTAHSLFVGDIVNIPPGASLPGASSGQVAGGQTGSDPEGTPAGVGCQHTIVLNENPSRVANKYEITVDELRSANASSNVVSTFVVGQVLNIPANGNCS